MYDIENYYNAETIKEAVLLLKEHPDARIISGGSDVLIKIREGKMAGTSLVSIRDIKEIRGIRLMDSGDIFIGAATTFSHVTKDPVIQKLIPVLGEAVDQVGWSLRFAISGLSAEMYATVQSAQTVRLLCFP